MGGDDVIDLPYSLVIEATQEPDSFGFYSPDLEGFTGIGRSIEDCLYKAKRGMIDHVELLKEESLPVPEKNPDPAIVIQNAKDHHAMVRENSFYLYHYTTADSFINIVEKQEIWASNIFYLNDSAEFHWAVRLARELLGTLIGKETDTRRKRTLEVVRGHLEEARPGTITGPVFAWCLSKEKDDLSQWRGYCPNGGIAIGFRRKELEDLADKQVEQGPGYVPKLVPCIYERQEQVRVILACVDEAVKAAPGGRVGKSMSPEDVNQYKAVFLQGILANTPIKHAGFEHEWEWRLVISPGPNIEAGPEIEPRLGFRSRNGLIIPFWRIALAPKGDKKIWRDSRIIIGPNPHQQELKESVESLLKHYCTGPDEVFRGTVKTSQVPYRYW
jgi:predicted RNase H-like HicB family nuclease